MENIFTSILFPAGRQQLFVPEGVLFGSTNAHKKLRIWLLDECKIHGIISLPSGVFKPYAGVKTSVVIFERGGKTDKVWFYEITADGFSLDDNRNPHPDQNDIPDLIGKWQTKPESERSWYAERKEIDENDLNLTAGRYKPYVHEEVKYSEPKNIISEVLEIEDKINKGLKILT